MLFLLTEHRPPDLPGIRSVANCPGTAVAEVGGEGGVLDGQTGISCYLKEGD